MPLFRFIIFFFITAHEHYKNMYCYRKVKFGVVKGSAAKHLKHKFTRLCTVNLFFFFGHLIKLVKVFKIIKVIKENKEKIKQKKMKKVE